MPSRWSRSKASRSTIYDHLADSIEVKNIAVDAVVEVSLSTRAPGLSGPDMPCCS